MASPQGVTGGRSAPPGWCQRSACPSSSVSARSLPSSFLFFVFCRFYERIPSNSERNVHTLMVSLAGSVRSAGNTHICPESSAAAGKRHVPQTRDRRVGTPREKLLLLLQAGRAAGAGAEARPQPVLVPGLAAAPQAASSAPTRSWMTMGSLSGPLGQNLNRAGNCPTTPHSDDLGGTFGPAKPT